MNSVSFRPRISSTRKFVSSRIWRRYSIAESGIFDLAQYVRLDVWAERFRSYKFNPALQQVFKQKTKRHEMIERLLAGTKFHQEVNVAICVLLAAHERAEQAQARHAQGAHARPVLSQHGKNPAFIRNGLFNDTHGDIIQPALLNSSMPRDEVR